MAGCGPCNLCCDLMGVQMQPLEDSQKPPHTPCKFMCNARGSEGGCSVYDSRPDSCRVFECLWLFTQKLNADVRLPKFMRPDKTGVVIEVNSHGNLAVHCKNKDDWKKKPVYGYLHEMSKRTVVLIGNEDRAKTYRLNPDHTVSMCIPLGLAPNGENTYAVDESPKKRLAVALV